MKPWTDLDDLLNWIWSHVEAAASNRDHPMRTPALATAGFEEPQVRTVVLRQADRAARHMAFHSDRRAQKIAEIRANDRIAWHVWNTEESVQLRLRGHATVHTKDTVADEMWMAESPRSLALYLKDRPPASLADEPVDGLPDHAKPGSLTREDISAGRVHFAAVRTVIDHIDALHLRRDRHQRARFRWDGADQAWDADWLIP